MIREAFFGVRRFDEFLHRLGLPRARLTERLKHLVDHDVLTKQAYTLRPPRYEYRLTSKGRDIYGMTLMMKQWGDQWRTAKPRPALKLIHNSCNQDLFAELVCTSCEKIIEVDAIDVPIASNKKQTTNVSIDASTNASGQSPVRRQLLRKAFENDSRNDSVARTLAVIGDHWTMRIIAANFLGTRTFDALQLELDIPRGTLSTRLSHLIDEDIFVKHAYQQKPQRFEYRLTAAGLDLYRVGIMMHEWGLHWCLENKRAKTRFIHKECGKPLVPNLICNHCKITVLPEAVTVKELEL